MFLPLQLLSNTKKLSTCKQNTLNVGIVTLNQTLAFPEKINSCHKGIPPRARLTHAQCQHQENTCLPLTIADNEKLSHFSGKVNTYKAFFLDNLKGACVNQLTFARQFS